MGKEEDKKHLKKLVEKAKDGFAFGLCLAKTAGHPSIEYSGTKSPDALEKNAKAAAGGTKTGRGTLSLDKGKVVFTFLDKPPTGAFKAIKSFFAASGVTAKIALVGPDGKMLDDEAAVAEKAKLTVDFQRMAAALGAVKTGLENMQAQINGLTDRMMAAVQAKDPDIEAIRDVFLDLEQLDKLARRIPPQGQPQQTAPGTTGNSSQNTAVTPPSPVALAEEFKKSLESLRRKASDSNGLGKTITTLTEGFKKAFGEKPVNFKQLQTIADTAKKLDADTVNDNPATRTDAEKLVVVDGDWAKAVDTAGKELGKLRGKINEAVAGMPGAAKVDSAFGNLSTTLDRLAKALAGAIRAGNGKSGVDARKAADNALKTADQVARILAADPILSKIDDNPFEKTKVVATLSTTIEKMRQELAA
jgi:hypothetical protein